MIYTSLLFLCNQFLIHLKKKFNLNFKIKIAYNCSKIYKLKQNKSFLILKYFKNKSTKNLNNYL